MHCVSINMVKVFVCSANLFILETFGQGFLTRRRGTAIFREGSWLELLVTPGQLSCWLSLRDHRPKPWRGADDAFNHHF